jgi:nudix motif 8
MSVVPSVPLRFDDDVLSGVRSRLASLTRRRLTGDMPRASVLVPLCHVDGRAAVLFTKRTETVGTHKGQVSFPGGRRDEGDEDAVHTALRELHEETGIGADRVLVLGQLHEAMAITGVGVSCVVGFVGDVDPGALRVATAEIDLAFALPLPALVDPRHRVLQLFGRHRAPRFTAGPHPVWGLTAHLLDEFLREGLALALPELLPGQAPAGAAPGRAPEIAPEFGSGNAVPTASKRSPGQRQTRTAHDG